MKEIKIGDVDMNMIEIREQMMQWTLEEIKNEIIRLNDDGNEIDVDINDDEQIRDWFKNYVEASTEM